MIPSLQHGLPLYCTRRGTRAAILGEAGDDQPADDERGLDADTWGSNAPGVGGGGYGSAEVDARRGGTGMRRTDRIARRQARTEASAGGGGWVGHRRMR